MHQCESYVSLLLHRKTSWLSQQNFEQMIGLFEQAYGLCNDHYPLPGVVDWNKTVFALWVGGRLPHYFRTKDKYKAMYKNAQDVKSYNAVTSLMFDEFLPLSKLPGNQLPGFEREFPSIKVSWHRLQAELKTTQKEAIRERNKTKDFISVPCLFVGRRGEFVVDYDFEADSKSTEYDLTIGRVTTCCSVAVLSLFSPLSAVKFKVGDKTIYVGRACSHPRVNCRPKVLMQRIYDETKIPSESGLFAQCLGLSSAGRIVDQPMTGFAYSIKNEPATGGACDISPSIVIPSHAENVVNTRQCFYLTNDAVIELAGSVLSNYDHVISWYEAWQKQMKRDGHPRKSGLYSLQFLGVVLREFTREFNGLQTMEDWQKLWIHLKINFFDEANMEPPDYFHILYQQVRVMIAASSRIRIGWLDGLGRVTAANYLLSLKFPQSEGSALGGTTFGTGVPKERFKFNVIVEENRLLYEVGCLHPTVSIVAYNELKEEVVSPERIKQLEDFSRNMLSSQSKGRKMGLAEFFENMSSALRDKALSLTWDYARELTDYEATKAVFKGESKSIPIRHPAHWWRIFTFYARRDVFPLFLSAAAVNEGVKTYVNNFKGHLNQKGKACMSELQKFVCEKEGCNDKDQNEKNKQVSVGEYLNMAHKNVHTTLKHEMGKEVPSDSTFFYHMEHIYFNNGFFYNPNRMFYFQDAIYYTIVHCFTYVDRYPILSPSGSKLVMNQVDRPFQILSNFASSNGGGDNFSPWIGMKDWINPKLQNRSLRKVSNIAYLHIAYVRPERLDGK
jgi:hypothetical protein